MLKVLHVSEVYNRKSILKHGLIPTRTRLQNHLYSFNEDGLIGNKTLYTWVSCDKDNKFIKDMVFCKAFIDPRNTMYDNDNDIEIDFSKLLNKNLYKFDKMQFDVYEATIDSRDYSFCMTNYIHGQFPEFDKNNTMFGMPDKYSHFDKQLCVLDGPIKNLKIIKKAYLSYEKHNKYNVRVE